MNGKTFYLEVGKIDDDLILEASEACGLGKCGSVEKCGSWEKYGSQRTCGSRTRAQGEVSSWVFRLAGIAACFCLICAVLLFSARRDMIYFNESDPPMTSKVMIPADENTTIQSLSYPELLAYYGIQSFPDKLASLNRLELGQYYIYRDQELVLYDTNILHYKSADDRQNLSVMIAKEDSDPDIPDVSEEQSRIDGISLVLSMSEKFVAEGGQPVYWAEIDHGEVSIRMISYDMDKESFITVVREAVQSLK